MVDDGRGDRHAGDDVRMRCAVIILSWFKYAVKRCGRTAYYVLAVRGRNRRVALRGVENILVVAHPDDEMIFFRQFLKRHGSTTLVLCITNGGHPTRQKEFMRSVARFQARGVILNFPDEPRDWPGARVEQVLDAVVRASSATQLVTHNEQGEYGHPHHRQLHEIVRRVGVRWHRKRGIEVLTAAPNERLLARENRLSEAELSEKLACFADIYASQRAWILDEAGDCYRFVVHEALPIPVADR